MNYFVYLLSALIIPYSSLFLWWFCLLVVVKFYSRVSYFNLLFITLGYNFYYLTLSNDGEILLITKQKIKSPRGIDENIKILMQ